MTDELKTGLDSLLAGGRGLVRQAESAMPADEHARLRHALDTGSAQLTVTILLPSGAVRVGVVGEWQGERTLWEMVPNQPVLERKLDG
jgi:hypothetical protein